MSAFQNPIIPLWEQAESRRLEFKEKFPKADHIAKTVIAFANGAGGKMVFGVVNNPRQVIGIPPDKIRLLDFCQEERSIKEMMAFHFFQALLGGGLRPLRLFFPLASALSCA